MRALGLRGRTTVALVVTAAVACLGLSGGTLVWAQAQHLGSLEEKMYLTLDAGMDHVVEAIAANPTTRQWQDIAPETGYGLSSDAALFRFEAQSSPFRPEQVEQFAFSDEPLNQRIPECLVPRPEWLDGRSITDIPYTPGSWGGWVNRCGDHLMGFGYTEVPGRDGPFAWLLIYEYPIDRAESPVPGLATTLGLISGGVVLLAVLLAGGVAASVVRPVTRAGAMAHAVADGDLSVRIPVVGDDDVAAMSMAVNAMADRLTDQIARLKAANEGQRQFVSDVAHELRTPTTALLASAEALADPATRDRAAALVAPQLRRLAGLTEDLLEISRMDAGRAEFVASRIDLADLIAEVVADSGAADQVAYQGPDELLITTDPARLRVVLRNLVANALQHGAPPVTITATAKEREATVSVRDSGSGVPTELRDRVFDRFVRGDQARHGRSSGLGLAIAAENAKLLGADLGLEPDGVTFTLRWQLDNSGPKAAVTPANQ